MSSKNDEEYAKKLLRVIDVVEKYQYYIARRTIGVLYLTIAATISIFLFITLSLLELVPVPLKVIIFAILFTLALIAIWFISANLFKLPKIYQTEEYESTGKKIGLTWLTLSLVYILIMMIDYITPLPQFTVPLYTQIFVGLGNLGNYIHNKGKKHYPGEVVKEYLYFAIILLLSSPMIPMFKGYEWFIVTIFTLTGTYIFGIYIVLTSDKALE